MFITSLYYQLAYALLNKGTEELLKKETGIKDTDVTPDSAAPLASEVSHALAAYKRYTLDRDL